MWQKKVNLGIRKKSWQPAFASQIPGQSFKTREGNSRPPTQPCLNTGRFEDIKRHSVDTDGICRILLLLHRGDWASQRPTGFNRISSCSNLRPISWLLQWWSQAVLFFTCLRCSLIESLLQSAGRLAFWYNVIAVSYLQTLIPRLNHTCSRGGKPLSALHKRTLAFAKYRTLLSSRATPPTKSACLSLLVFCSSQN